MRWSKAALIARKEFGSLRRRKSLYGALVAFPIGIAIGFAALIRFAGASSGGIPASYLPTLLDAFGFFFVIGAGILPTSIAAYSLVGEKVEKSLEPLLATPSSDSEILLGKTLGALVPTLGAMGAGSILFMILMDATTRSRLGYLYYPNGTIGVEMLVCVPLAALLSTEVSVLISARVSDVRSAQQIAGLMVLPLAAVYVGAEINAFPLDIPHMLYLAGALAVIDVPLFFLTRATFQREEILTHWR